MFKKGILLSVCLTVVFGYASSVYAGEVVTHKVKDPEAAIAYWTPE